MTLPKFIITMDGYFRLGMVNQHKDLLKPGDSWWYLLEVLKVPSVYRGLQLVYFYDDREFDVSQELQIEYYD